MIIIDRDKSGKAENYTHCWGLICYRRESQVIGRGVGKGEGRGRREKGRERNGEGKEGCVDLYIGKG